ncbi:50S ribosomal protein L17 [candidate division KSB1 bacterium]|nr:50S ribosomal protein L17 [candidate division KSB1 bacterium]
MRHKKSGRKLGRTKSHRKATLSNLATALFREKKIRTTTAKAKETRSFAEKLITFAKKGDLASRRQVLRVIKDKAIVRELFDDIAPVFEKRNGGYTRIIKLGQRKGDAAPLSYIELVDFEKTQKGGEKKKKRLRDRFARSKAKKETEVKEEVATEELDAQEATVSEVQNEDQPSSENK